MKIEGNCSTKNIYCTYEIIDIIDLKLSKDIFLSKWNANKKHTWDVQDRRKYMALDFGFSKLKYDYGKY